MEKIAALDWMLAVLQNAKPLGGLLAALGQFENRDPLISSIREGRLSERNKALSILANRRGIRSAVIREYLDISKIALQRYLRAFNEGGPALLMTLKKSGARKSALRLHAGESVEAIFAREDERIGAGRWCPLGNRRKASSFILKPWSWRCSLSGSRRAQEK
jgi:hypothetical protein